MPYPETLLAPMRQELTRIGITELKTAAEVDEVFGAKSEGTILLVINSVCGCAASNARPAINLAQQSAVLPDQRVTVFAGQDLEATERAREYLPGIPPSSPFMALFKFGVPVFVLERRNIEGRSASAIATDLVRAFEMYCSPNGESSGESSGESNGESSGAANRESNDAAVDASGDTDPGTFRSIL
jgi:putative YphP/YqiW family bacilliredoxin